MLCRHEFRRIFFRENQQNDHLENIKQLQNYTTHKINKHIIVHLHLHSGFCFCISFDFILIHTFIHWFNYILFSFLIRYLYNVFQVTKSSKCYLQWFTVLLLQIRFLICSLFFCSLTLIRFYQFRMCVILVFVCNCSSVLLAFSVRKPSKIAMRWDLRQYQNICIATKERKCDICGFLFFEFFVWHLFALILNTMVLVLKRRKNKLLTSTKWKKDGKK